MGRWGGRDCPYGRDGGSGSGISGHTTNELVNPFQKGTPEDTGYNAYKAKKNTWDNPHQPIDRANFRGWVDGYNRAQSDSKKKPKDKTDTRHWALKQLDEE